MSVCLSASPTTGPIALEIAVEVHGLRPVHALHAFRTIRTPFHIALTSETS